MILSRRRILTGLIAAPIVVRTAGILMPIKPLPPEIEVSDIVWTPTSGGLLRWAVIWGADHTGKPICEKIDLPAADAAGERVVSRKDFRSISAIETTNVIPGLGPLVSTVEKDMVVGPGDTITFIAEPLKLS